MKIESNKYDISKLKNVRKIDKNKGMIGEVIHEVDDMYENGEASTREQMNSLYVNAIINENVIQNKLFLPS